MFPFVPILELFICLSERMTCMKLLMYSFCAMAKIKSTKLAGARYGDRGKPWRSWGEKCKGREVWFLGCWLKWLIRQVDRRKDGE